MAWATLVSDASGYPQALVERIVAARPGPDVLDVGIGTGIAARHSGSLRRGLPPGHA